MDTGNLVWVKNVDLHWPWSPRITNANGCPRHEATGLSDREELGPPKSHFKNAFGSCVSRTMKTVQGVTSNLLPAFPIDFLHLAAVSLPPTLLWDRSPLPSPELLLSPPSTLLQSYSLAFEDRACAFSEQKRGQDYSYTRFSQVGSGKHRPSFLILHQMIKSLDCVPNVKGF